MADLRIVDAPEIPTENITGEEKLPTGGSGNYSISLDSLADYTKTKKDLVDSISVDGKVNGVRQELEAHIEDLLNPHQVTKGQIGLGNVDNTADADKPVSNSTQAAIISAVSPKADKSYADSQLALKANKDDVYTKSETYSRQETQGLVDDKISIALPPINSEIDYIERYTPLPYKLQNYAVGQRVTLSTGEIVENRVTNNNVDPNTDMLGWVKVNSADRIFDANGLSQQQVTDGLSSLSELLSVIAKNGSRQYVNGQQAGWFKYNASRIAENDGGTILNGWERIDFDAITFDMFACDPTGDTAVDDKLLKICAASTALKKPIHQFTGTYLVNSSNEFTFTENTLLDGSKFKLGSSFSGKFICRRNDIAETILTEGAAFDEIKGIGMLQAGRLNLLGSTVFASAYVGYYAEFVTSQPLYIYRGETKGAKLFTRILQNGRLESGSYFNLDLAQLTSIRLQSVAESVRIYSGFCFDESLATSVVDYFHVQSSNRTVVRNTTYIDKSAANRAVNQTRLTVSNSFNVIVDDLDATSALYNSNNTYNYTLTLSNSYDIKVKRAKAFGRGWGATGSNNCSSITFEDCTLNRIDFHEPCYDWLKVNDCILGDWGILSTMIGDLHINGSTFLNYEGVGNRGIIRSRTDTGGFCYGDLYLNNAKLSGYSGNSIDAVILCQGDGVLPPESPIEAVMFNNVYIDGLRSKYTYANVSALLTADRTTTLNKPPKVIEAKSVQGFNPIVDFGKFAFRSDTVILTMNGITNPLLYISDAEGKGTKVEAVLDNVRHADAVTVLNTANCDMRIANSKLVRYREFNAVWNAFSPTINISDSQMTANDYISLNVGVTKNRVALNNVRLINPTATAYLPLMPKARHLNCRFNSSASYFTVWSGSAASGSFDIHSSSGIVSLYIVYGSVKRVVNIDPSTAQIINIESGVTIVITLSGTTATVTLNAANARLIAIMSNN